MTNKALIVAGVAAAGVAGLAIYLWLKRPPTKIETRMVVTEAPPGNVSQGQEFRFCGCIEDVNGNRLAGKTVELYVDGGVAASGTTDTDGRWGWAITLTKSATLYAVFPGDEEYVGCSRRW